MAERGRGGGRGKRSDGRPTGARALPPRSVSDAAARQRSLRSSWARRTASLIGAVLFAVACSSAPSAEVGPASTVVTSDTVVASDSGDNVTAETNVDDVSSTTSSDIATETDGTTADSTSVSAETTATNGDTGSTAPISKVTTTTVRSSGVATSTTLRVTTTTVKPKPTTTVPQPPTTPAPTPPPTPPPTPAPTSPPRTIGSCQQLSLDTVNGWRATLGRPALSSSSSLYSGACSWATHLAETDTIGHAPGVSGEVIAFGRGNCSEALSIWLGSGSHYAVLTASIPSAGGIACVKDSEGTFWAVGRLA